MTATSKPTLVVASLVGACLLCPPGARAAENPWAVPPGVRVAPPRADGIDVAGPVLVAEPQLPLGTVVDGFMLSNLNGTPIGATTVFNYAVNGVPSTDPHAAGGPGGAGVCNPPRHTGGV